jgi:hypothetical protein
MIRVTDLPEPGAYVKAWRRGRELTAAGQKVRFFWGSADLNAEQFTRAMRRALDLRINARVGPEPKWRKLDDLYQTELHRDASDLWKLRTFRIRPGLAHWRSPECRMRFAHLLAMD